MYLVYEVHLNDVKIIGAYNKMKALMIAEARAEAQITFIEEGGNMWFKQDLDLKQFKNDNIEMAIRLFHGDIGSDDFYTIFVERVSVDKDEQ